MCPSTYSPNRDYQLMATGEDVNTWGINTNANLSLIDQNLGGTLNISVAGNSNITLTSSQAANLIHNLTGALTGNIDYIFPQAGGFFAVNNQTTGAYTVTVQVAGGSGGIVVAQGTTVTIYIDATVPSVEAFIGTTYNFIGGTVGGTENALTISQTFPPNFTLNTGTFISFIATNTNTASATLNVNGTGPITIQKPTYAGLANLIAGDLAPNLPVLAIYTGSVWYGINIVPVGYETTVSTNQNVGFGNNLTPYVNTANITYTIAHTTTLLNYWFVTISAQGGTATITPYSTDIINYNGTSLAAGASLVMPQGSSATLFTDANGNLFVTAYTGVVPPGAVLSNGVIATTQTTGDYSTKVATDAFVQNNIPGGFLNKFRNPGFTIAQRGTSGTIFTTASYGLDGWIGIATGANGAWSQVSNNGYNAALKIAGAVSNTDLQVYQRIESTDAQWLQGKQATAQWTITNNSGTTLTPKISTLYPSSKDIWTTTSTDLASTSMQSIASSTTAVVSYSFPVSANAANGYEVVLDVGALNSTTKSVTVTFADIRVTPNVTTGTNSTPPPPEITHVSYEFTRSQRYLPAYNAASSTQTNIAVGAVAINSSTSIVVYKYPTTARVAPTGVTVSNSSHFAQGFYNGLSTITTTAATIGFVVSSLDDAVLSLSASTGSAGQVSFLTSLNSSAQLLFTGAEL